MASKRGGKRPGAGRPLGSKDKAKAASDRRVEELMANVPDCDSVDPKVRLEAVLKSMPGINGLVIEYIDEPIKYFNRGSLDTAAVFARTIHG